MKLIKCLIHTQSFDTRLLSSFYNNIKNAVTTLSGLQISGSVMLPIHIKKITVNRSPHIDKKSREQFEIRKFTRLIHIVSIGNNENIMEALKQIKKQSPVGLDIKVVFTYDAFIHL